MNDADVNFMLIATGVSASINSTEFYECNLCGACVLDVHRRDTNRQRHTAWHATVQS